MVKNAKEFSESDRVSHSIYGAGTITSIGEQHTIIEFDEHGRKKFMTSIVEINHCDVQAPPPKKRKTKAKAKAKP